jgi:hypothetical protein
LTRAARLTGVWLTPEWADGTSRGVRLPPGSGDVHRFAWLLEDPSFEWLWMGECLTFVRGPDAHETPKVLVTDTVRGRVVVADENGYQGVTPDVVERVSAGARLLSVYWNVNGHSRCCTRRTAWSSPTSTRAIRMTGPGRTPATWTPGCGTCRSGSVVGGTR